MPAQICVGRYRGAVTSNVACIGFGSDDEDALRSALSRAVALADPLGARGGLRVLRWQDDLGARLVVALDESGEVASLTPSLAGEPGALLTDLVHLDEELWSARVVDEGGEQVTALVADVEQSALLDPTSPPTGRASVVALGIDVEVLADDVAFTASPSSLLAPGSEPGEPPAHFVANGWSWPVRMATESFISHGVFSESAEAEAIAQLNGTVLAARTCRNSLTGDAFHVLRVRTAGFEADMCLSAADHPVLPGAGSVVAGTVYLVVSLADVPAPVAAPRRRRLFGRRPR